MLYTKKNLVLYHNKDTEDKALHPSIFHMVFICFSKMPFTGSIMHISQELAEKWLHLSLQGPMT